MVRDGLVRAEGAVLHQLDTLHLLEHAEQFGAGDEEAGDREPVGHLLGESGETHESRPTEGLLAPQDVIDDGALVRPVERLRGTINHVRAGLGALLDDLGERAEGLDAGLVLGTEALAGLGQVGESIRLFLAVEGERRDGLADDLDVGGAGERALLEGPEVVALEHLALLHHEGVVVVPLVLDDVREPRLAAVLEGLQEREALHQEGADVVRLVEGDTNEVAVHLFLSFQWPHH